MEQAGNEEETRRLAGRAGGRDGGAGGVSIQHGPRWPTIDGPLGLSEEESLSYARKYFKFGFFLLPWLWALNCFYFWPVLRNPDSFPRIRRYVFHSAIGFGVSAVVLSTWALVFMIGGEQLFGSAWNRLVMYNIADKYGLTSWNQ